MEFLASINRFFTFRLLTSSIFYFPGMVFFRLGRKLRKINFGKSEGQLTGLREITVFSNVRMKVEASAYMGGSLFWSGMHHVNEVIYLNRTLKSDDVFVDVGANQGEFSMFAASKLKNGKVLSFEPVSYQLGLLKDNVKLNGFENCVVYGYGLSDRNDKLPIYTSVEQGKHAGINEGLSSLYPSGDVTEEQEIIDLKVFDEQITPNLDRLDFLKIDVEGAELYALKGMEKALVKFKPEILIEMNERTFQAAGYSMQEMLEYLSKFGYQAYRLSRGRLVKLDGGLESLKAWQNFVLKSV